MTAQSGADVIVIGGGLHGCSAALHLAMCGLNVLVLEKDYVGRHASGVNAGGVRRLGRVFAEVPLSVAAAKMWHGMRDLVDDDCMFRASNQIRVAESEEQLLEQVTRIKKLESMGFGHEQIIDRKTLQEYLPKVSPHCIGGTITEGDGHANPYRTVQAFKRKCIQSGVRFIEGVAVKSIERSGDLWKVITEKHRYDCNVIVNCAGAWAGKFAAMLGEPVPLSAEAPMLMITQRLPHFVTPVVGAQGRPLSFKQFDNGTVLIGGGHQGRAYTETNHTQLNFNGLAACARTAADIFPMMANAKIVRCWAGIEGVMPDHIPVIGPSQEKNAFHAFGFSAHGFQLAPVCGKIISDFVAHGKTELPISPFAINRFK